MLPGGCCVPLPERQASYAAAGFLRGDRDRGGPSRCSACGSSITSACARGAPGIAVSARLNARMQDTRGGLRPADSPHLFQPFFAIVARAAQPLRPRATLPSGDRRPDLGRPVPAARRAGARVRGRGGLAAAGAHCDLSALQLRHARRVAGARCYERLDWLGAVDGNRHRARRGAPVSRLGESVPRVAAEQSRPAASGCPTAAFASSFTRMP